MRKLCSLLFFVLDKIQDRQRISHFTVLKLDAPAGNHGTCSCFHQNKHPVRDDELFNYHDSLQAHLMEVIDHSPCSF